MDLSEAELIGFPDDPIIPHLLLDDSQERRLASQGRQREAFLLRRQRRHLYRVWIHALGRLKCDVTGVQLRARRRSFEEILGFEWRVTRGLAKLRIIGFLHFTGITRRLDKMAVETVRGMAVATEPARLY